MVSKYLGKNTPLYLEHFNREEKKNNACNTFLWCFFYFLLATLKSELTQCLILEF